MARLPNVLLGRSLAPAGAGRARARARGQGQGRVRGTGGTRGHARRGAPRGLFAAPLVVARTGMAFVWSRRRLRVALLLALLTPALAAGGWMLLRSSSLSRVEKVQISGVGGRQAPQIEAALRRTARGMSTLHVKLGVLRAAVARFPIVRDLRVRPSFPHGLRITVIEQPPVAVLSAGGQRVAVAADGVVLGPELISSTLPSVHLSGVAPLTGRSVQDATARAELSILGAAPPTLLGWVDSIESGSEGVVARMRGDVQIYFGDATRAHAKWLAAARVLADSGSAGATYIDVRVPARPVAGTSAPGGLSSAAAASATAGTSATSLAARLDEAVAGGSAGAAAEAATSPAAGAGETPSTETPSTEPSTSATSESNETTSGGTGSTEAAAGSTATGESSGGGGEVETAQGGATGATGETPGTTGAATATGGATAEGG